MPVRSAEANSRPQFQLPFQCGQKWRAVTRDNHSPNPHSLDLFRVGGETSGQPVLASAAGQVRLSGWDSGGGWMVEIDHGSDWGTSYLHLIEKSTAEEGQRVERGQQIGIVGSSGASSAPHLHYQQWIGHQNNTVRAVFNGVEVTVAPGKDEILTSHNCFWDFSDGTGPWH
ncbi:hypothetical protein GCM10012275_26530 [Longimycelium tulufanense]|uniref:M23ase beta-sheet core domain-containing protein n=1 Tax=Longimycelium tulufanense TaxID=907463 RepID=A0A8J3FWL6_9PSEU|nr:hypothetical protein GCM10012275_26530 [Longimycelium tulufanense]